MSNKYGPRPDIKQDPLDKVMEQAKAESDFSAKLYDLLFDYQERLFQGGYKNAWKKPLTGDERVGDLNLPLSRLYEQIWSAVLGMTNQSTPVKKKQVELMEVE